MLTNLRDAFIGQSGSPNIVPFHMLDIVSSCAIVTLCFYAIRLQKCRDLENRVRSTSRSLEMSPLDRARMTSYWRSIVTMALSRVISEIFNVENIVTLKLGSEFTQGHWNLYHSVDRLWKSFHSYFVLVFFSNFVLKRSVFEIFDL